ncbi:MULTISPECIES: ABC transporter ATP-binding protein [Cyanophyceae]|uniref:ABC transporter ATP-binding protein n=1 Tax=Cyanophyceae TaxID=3028117 RepID=UPI00016DCD37|nr:MULTISPECIES: ABC transporter ATP-binding protein [Cyanophyceae]ACB00758.1 ABC transporter family protein [Picosynechococcus sp. PCC 7002]SMH51735.1 ATP-binding cassette, subfamily B [Picosynechococcus sp. OG1]SMQ82179.1 ATP-binding cassette, subfamily B [Synechococcus sp. 7002]
MAASSRLRRLLAYLKPYQRDIWLGIGALILVNGLGVYLPIILSNTVDSLQTDVGLGNLTRAVLLMLLLASVMWGIRMLSRVAIFGVGRQVEFDLKQKIFQHLLTLEPAYFASQSSGDLINRATSDVDNVRRLLGFSVLSLANTVFAYAMTLPVMLSLHGKLSVMAIAVYPAMLLTVQLFSGRLRDEQKEVQEELSELSQLIQEDMSGISLIKIYAQEANERQAFDKQNQKLLQANLGLARIRNLLFPIIEGISYISLLILLIFGTRAITADELTVGNFIALILLVERLVVPTALLGFTITSYQRGEVSIDRIEAILDNQPLIQDRTTAHPLDRHQVEGQIVAKHLSFTYPGDNRPALDDLNFTINPGEIIAIVGSIGAGKSTLANALPRLIDIEPGQLFLDGQDLTDIRLQDLRQAIAYVPQESFLFSSQIRDNIAYGLPGSDQPEIESSAQQAQIHHEILNFPRQYNTLVGERGITLSGGQRQRSSLARAFMIDAPVLILDDALSSVDNKTATEILDYLSHSPQNKTVIFITHQLSAAAKGDRIFVMDHGKIVQTGIHEELINQDGLYKQLWEQNQLAEILT